MSDNTDITALLLPQSIDALASAISSIGHSAFENDFGDFVANLSGYQQMLMVAFFEDGRPRLLFSRLPAGQEERIVAPYLASAYLLDPWYNMVRTGTGDGVFLLSDHAPDDFEQSEYYREYYRQTQIENECAIFIRLSNMTCLVLSLGTTAGEQLRNFNLGCVRKFYACLRSLCCRHYAGLDGGGDRATDSLEEICRKKGLSGREVEVTSLLLRGYSNKVIARELSISPETVKVYRKRINKKLRTSTAREIFVDFFSMPGAEEINETGRAY